MARFLGRTRGYRTLVVDRRGGTRDRVMAFLAEHAGLRAGLGTVERRASLADSFEHNVGVINAFRPDVITGFSGYLGAMFRWARAHGRSVQHPRLIWCGGETLPEPDRGLLDRELGIPVIQTYQSCEFLRIAFQCERREGFHINVDQVAVRVVDAGGAPVPPGTRGRVVVSGLLNRATVLLNYALGDLGALAGASCGCGRTLPVLARVDGREDDFLLRADGRLVHTAVVISSLYAVPGVVRLQLIQEALARFHLRVVCATGADWAATRLALGRALASLMGPGELSVEIAQVPDIAPEPSGKVRLVLSKAARLREAP
jgi:phenylacetate-CoA ligase